MDGALVAVAKSDFVVRNMLGVAIEVSAYLRSKYIPPPSTSLDKVPTGTRIGDSFRRTNRVLMVYICALFPNLLLDS